MKLIKGNRKFKIEDIEFEIGKFSLSDKKEIMAHLDELGQPKSIESVWDVAVFALKRGLKDIKGIFYDDGEEFKLKFDESGLVEDSIISEILSLPVSDKFIMIASSVVMDSRTEIPEEITFTSKKKEAKVEK